MKVYLLRVNEERAVFYAETEAVEANELKAEETGDGFFAALGKKYNDLQRALRESESGVGLRMRRAWEWLQRRTSPDESLLRSLRGVSSVELYHPSAMSAAEAREEWGKYLRGRRPGIILWLVLNALVTPITLLLAPIPGPNVIGYWFTYRAICHTLALLGIRRANEIEPETHASTALDFYLERVAEVDDEDRLQNFAQVHGLRDVESFAARVARGRRPAGPAKLAVTERANL